MNQLQPAGGLGDDKVGGLSALRSLFDTGWVIGGYHEAISSTAATLKIAKGCLQKKKNKYILGHWPKRGEEVQAKSKLLISTEFGIFR